VILAADHAEFALPEMQRGLLADAGAVQRLPRRIPYNVAVELLLTGRRMGAAEAVHWGLAHKAIPADELMPAAREIAQTIAEGAPLAVQALLEVLPAIDRLDERAAFARLKPGRSGLDSYERMLASEDFSEGPRAFAEKRKPVWKGR
jgi:crotonobetainyl-CoA hydratase